MPVSPKLVLFFGLIRPYKGLEWLLKAATELHKNGEEVCFCIAGEPYTDWEPYQRIIDASAAPERFYTYLKFIPKEDVHMFFSAADIVCLPYTSASQSGVTAIAMHYHKPVVATDVGGLKEYFDGTNRSHLCSKGVHALTEAIRSALSAEPAEAASIDTWNARFAWQLLPNNASA